MTNKVVQNGYEITQNKFQIGVEEFLVSCQAGKEPTDQGTVTAIKLATPPHTQ